jgi:MerR family transcriptional regulator, light-induced transcriptional regulator
MQLGSCWSVTLPARSAAQNDNGMDFVGGLLAASAGMSPPGVRDHLDRAVLALGLGGCVDDVLLPAMRQIGVRWQLGQLDIETERLTTETVRSWLEEAARRAPRPGPIAPLVLACGPRDRHSIGLEVLGVLLRHRGRSLRMLGPRTSLRTLTTAVRATRPSGVVIVSHLQATRLSAAQSLRAAADLDTEVFYAGEAFATTAMRRDIPGIYLGTNFQAACRAIVDGPH